MSVEGPERQPDKASQVDMPGVPDARPATPEPAADAAAPKPEAAPVTVEAPVAQKTTPEPAPRPPVIKTKEDMARAVMRTRVDELDRDILDFQEQIDKEEDTGKQAKMRDKLAEKVSKRDEAYAEYKEAIKELDAKITKINQELAKISALRKDIGTLEAFIAANKGTLDKTKITELATKTRALDDKESELKKLTPKDREADLIATLTVYTAERLRITEDAERRDEIGEADRTLAREMAIALGETPLDEPAKPDVTAPNPGEPALSGKEKELILDNRIDQMAFDLAKLLAINVPTDTDTYGQFTFQAKRGLLMVLSYCGGDPAWTEQLTEKEKKDLGMTVFTKTDTEGKLLHTIKWEPLDFSLNKVQNVYEVAFGKNGWTKEMGELTPKTTVKELQDRAANFDEDTKVEGEVALKKFIATLLATGATPESGVKDFVARNSDKIIKVYKPETATTSSETGTQGSENAEFNADNVVRVIGEKKLHKKTSVKDVMNAVDPKWVAPAELSAADITKKASSYVDGFKTEGDLTVYQTSFKESARAAAMLGLPDPSKALEPIFAKALAELKAGKLEDTTKAELQQGIETQIKLMQEYLSQPFYAVLEREKPSANGQDLIDVEKVMAALDKNPVPNP